jgi:TetR/AcrR family fatty acid metabolism transcriptional regulator
MTAQPASDVERRKSDRVRSIVRSAYDIIGKSGFVNISLADIAAEAGISKALLHYYFRDKDELIGEVYEYAMDIFLEIAVPILAESAPLGERIDRLIESFGAFVGENPHWFAVVMELTLVGIKDPKRRRTILARHLSIRDVTAAAFSAGKREGEVAADIDERAVASLMIAGANGFALLSTIAPEATDLGRVGENFTAMLKRFIRP